jgi:hypothetical protein
MVAVQPAPSLWTPSRSGARLARRFVCALACRSMWWREEDHPRELRVHLVALATKTRASLPRTCWTTRVLSPSTRRCLWPHGRRRLERRAAVPCIWPCCWSRYCLACSGNKSTPALLPATRCQGSSHAAGGCSELRGILAAQYGRSRGCRGGVEGCNGSGAQISCCRHSRDRVGSQEAGARMHVAHRLEQRSVYF